MAATLKYEAIAVAGTYKDKVSGEQKTRFHKCGVVLESDKGLSLKLESLPLVGFDGWISFRVPQARAVPRPAPAAPAQGGGGGFVDDDIPFNRKPGMDAL